MKILFEGDSITDAGRDRSDIHHLGGGYPKYAAELIKEAFPDMDLEFVNTGVSGDRSCDMLRKLQTDIIDIQPDVISILIGVNDTWRRFDQNDPTTAEQYEENVRTILKAIKEKTSAKIIILEPFLLDVPERAAYHEDLDAKIIVLRRLAREYADAYVPLDGLFAAASMYEAPNFWAADGVHPTADGAQYIAEYYLDAFSSLIDEE